MALTLAVPSIPVVTLGTTTTTVYTVPNIAGCFFVAKSILIVNTGGVATTVSMSRVISGGSEATTNRFLHDLPLPVGETFSLFEVITLGPNESIRATAAVASAVRVTLSGFGKLT